MPGTSLLLPLIQIRGSFFILTPIYISMDWKEKVSHLLQEDERGSRKRSEERRVDRARRRHIDTYLAQRNVDAQIAARMTRGGAPQHVQQGYAGKDERVADRRIPYATRRRSRPKQSKSTEQSTINKILSDYSGQKKS